MSAAEPTHGSKLSCPFARHEGMRVCAGTSIVPLIVTLGARCKSVPVPVALHPQEPPVLISWQAGRTEEFIQT